MAPYVVHREVGRGPALVLAPHPDDEVFGCAGALLRHLAQGDSVSVVIVTDGGAFVQPREPYVAARRQESLNAAKVLGYGEPEFWNEGDRTLAWDEALVSRIHEAISRTKASFVYLTSPTDLHPDHRALGLCGLEAVRRTAHEVTAVLYEVGAPLTRPNRLVDLTDVRARKAAAIECFTSQLGRQRYAEQIAALNLFRTYTLPPQVEAAEAFRLIPRDQVSSELRALLTADLDLAGAAVPSDRDRPLISVIIRTTGRSTLDETLASVAAQLHARVEVVLVNATTQPLDVGPWCGRFPLRVVGGEQRRDRAAAANLGLDAAQGEFVTFLDDDDWLYPHHLERLCDALLTHRSTRVAYAGIECVQVKPDGTRERVNLYNDAFDAARLLTENYLPIHAPLFARSLVTEEGCRFDESLAVFEDWDFWIQTSRKTPFHHVPEIGGGYRLPGGSGLSGPDAATLVTATQARVLEKWSSRWTPEERSTLWRNAREHLSPTSANNAQRRALEQQVRALGEKTQRDTERLSELEQRLSSREAAQVTIAARLEESEERSRRLEASMAGLAAERQAQADASAQRERDLRDHVDALLAAREVLAARLEATTTELRQSAARVQTLEQALEAVRSDRDALWNSAALKTARLARRISPGVQEALGKTMRTLLGGPPRAAAIAPPASVPPPPPSETPTPPASLVAQPATPPEPVPTAPSASASKVPPLAWGDLRRTTPISPSWGFERGTPIDRYYGDVFLRRYGHLVHGVVLEIQRDEYTSRFGRDVVRVDTVDYVDTFQPTFVCDLSAPTSPLPVEAYDSVMVPYTLHIIPGVENAMRHLARALKPGGVMLCTMSTFVPPEPPGDHDYWHLPAPGWQELARRTWPGFETTVEAFGNSLSATMSMMGLAAEEVTPAELDVVDPRFPVFVGVLTRKPAA